MEALLSPMTLRFLHDAGALASEAGVPLLLVGGSAAAVTFGVGSVIGISVSL